MDIVGPLKKTKRQNKYILSIQDLLTKYSLAIPLPDQSAARVAEAFVTRFICIFGAPKSILTDNGNCFISGIMKCCARMFKIKRFRSTAYHPQTNGSVERSHHISTEYIKQSLDEFTEWDKLTDLASFAYNTSYHESTGYTPHQLIFGALAILPTSQPPKINHRTFQDYLTDLYLRLESDRKIAASNLKASKERQKQYYDRRLNEQNFGDKVFIIKRRTANKWDDHYEGPYRIHEVTNNQNVILGIKRRLMRYHINEVRIARGKRIHILRKTSQTQNAHDYSYEYDGSSS
uniref:Integrase catalytic domain-containing protein n=1 Tax=Bracon brevicornis TaxID=1563983 RepID=A0A6V7KQV1_9HYME